MTYDFHGQWDKKTGHVAPLYYHPDDDISYFNAVNRRNFSFLSEHRRNEFSYRRTFRFITGWKKELRHAS